MILERYMISDAARLVNVESHVLRYWEEELDIPIKRNELGHRYYTEDDIRLLQHVKELKEKGYQLKAIKTDIEKELKMTPVLESSKNVVWRDSQDKMQEFQSVLSKALLQAFLENHEELEKEITQVVGEKLAKELDYQFRMHEERNEEHYRKLDELIRNSSKRRKLLAKDENDKKTKKKSSFFTIKTQV